MSHVSVTLQGTYVTSSLGVELLPSVTSQGDNNQSLEFPELHKWAR